MRGGRKLYHAQRALCMRSPPRYPPSLKLCLLVSRAAAAGCRVRRRLWRGGVLLLISPPGWTGRLREVAAGVWATTMEALWVEGCLGPVAASRRTVSGSTRGMVTTGATVAVAGSGAVRGFKALGASHRGVAASLVGGGVVQCMAAMEVQRPLLMLP